MVLRKRSANQSNAATSGGSNKPSGWCVTCRKHCFSQISQSSNCKQAGDDEPDVTCDVFESTQNNLNETNSTTNGGGAEDLRFLSAIEKDRKKLDKKMDDIKRSSDEWKLWCCKYQKKHPSLNYNNFKKAVKAEHEKQTKKLLDEDLRMLKKGEVVSGFAHNSSGGAYYEYKKENGKYSTYWDIDAVRYFPTRPPDQSWCMWFSGYSKSPHFGKKSDLKSLFRSNPAKNCACTPIVCVCGQPVLQSSAPANPARESICRVTRTTTNKAEKKKDEAQLEAGSVGGKMTTSCKCPKPRCFACLSLEEQCIAKPNKRHRITGGAEYDSDDEPISNLNQTAHEFACYQTSGKYCSSNALSIALGLLGIPTPIEITQTCRRSPSLDFLDAIDRFRHLAQISKIPIPPNEVVNHILCQTDGVFLMNVNEHCMVVDMANRLIYDTDPKNPVAMQINEGNLDYLGVNRRFVSKIFRKVTRNSPIAHYVSPIAHYVSPIAHYVNYLEVLQSNDLPPHHCYSTMWTVLSSLLVPLPVSSFNDWKSAKCKTIGASLHFLQSFIKASRPTTPIPAGEIPSLLRYIEDQKTGLFIVYNALSSAVIDANQSTIIGLPSSLPISSHSFELLNLQRYDNIRLMTANRKKS